jgi:hypothetical protein
LGRSIVLIFSLSVSVPGLGQTSFDQYSRRQSPRDAADAEEDGDEVADEGAEEALGPML